MVAVEKMAPISSTARVLYFGLKLDDVRRILDLTRIR